MFEVDKVSNKAADPMEVPPVIKEEKVARLLTEILSGNIVDIRPQLDLTTKEGFSYPNVELILEAKGEQVISILESLTAAGIFKREFFDRFLRCPQCQSVNLRPSTHCPKCGSGNIVRGRILEHLICKYVGLEEEFMAKGRYICPKCRQEMRTIGTDYQSLGLLRKCRDCDEIFNIPLIKWRCMRCSSLTAEDKVIEVNLYSYAFSQEQKAWLEFELKPKTQLVEFLKHHGYEVTENAKIKGRSGAEHDIDILATRDDGIITHNVAIGIEAAKDKVELAKIFDFDDKAYDAGIHDKILVVIRGLNPEAEQFANQQRIKVFEVRDLEEFLTERTYPQPTEEIEAAEKEPFKFKSKAQLIESLKHHGYEVTENAKIKGRSGAEHDIGILATRDDGIITHDIAIGIEAAEKPIELAKIFDFDDKAYDAGIHDKVFIAIPGLSHEARQFAQRQRIKVFEAAKL